ncbi:MAG: ATP-binding domain-containing protein [Desulfuromonadaceae bacterium]|nr:ATP-binding domain-containing protein [Desulfuromonadaceae bacterium]
MSPVSIIRGTNDKPVSSQALITFYTKHPEYSGQLMIGYPIIGAPEGRHPIDALLISPDKGILLFDLVEGNDPGDYRLRQDDAANKLEARLKTHRDLMERRNLLIPVNTITFAPGVGDIGRSCDAEYPLTNLDSIAQALDDFCWSNSATDIYDTALSAIQSISTIRKCRTKRMITRPDSRGAKLKRLEDSIATLDNLQSKAVLETVEGVQRIRGLAGSGKTIVLALKAAYLHAQHPDWRIAVTFHTRSLKGQFKRLINNFSLEQTGEEPDWDNLRILSDWGAPGNPERDGIYYEFCRAHNIGYFDLRAAKRAFGNGNEFNGVCESALEQMQDAKPLYHAILVDEAQDITPAFLRLCYEMLDDRKRLVYAYDELQNLSGQSLPPPEEIFGKNPNGIPNVRFEAAGPGEPRRDVILEKCYRNSRPVLVAAHALGFGIYREPPRPNTIGLVQMFEHPHLWEEIGYQVKEGKLIDGSDVVLQRTDDTSPKFLEEHSDPDDLVQFINFDSEEEQAVWLAEAINRNLELEEMRHDDIVVINPDPLTTRSKTGPIRRQLLDLGINSHLAGVDTDPDVFFKPESASVTFTGIYRAKGNEAGMVYIINAQDCHSSAWNLASIRNRLFTAITRSKAWVRVLGVGMGMHLLTQEFERLKNHNFELQFFYPTPEQRKQLMVIHRDVSTEERKRLVEREKGLADLITDLEAGIVYPEDLDEGLMTKLKKLLANKG